MICAKCLGDKPEDQFGMAKAERSRGRSGRQSYCRACAASASRATYAKNRVANCAKSKKYREAHPEKMRDLYRRRSLLKLYGLTEAQHAEMLSAQNGACAICEDTLSRPFVDHNHATGAVRALLCQQCNSMLGYARDNPSTLANAITYLARHSAPRSTMKVA